MFNAVDHVAQRETYFTQIIKRDSDRRQSARNAAALVPLFGHALQFRPVVQIVDRKPQDFNQRVAR
jgi:hypothetical protein